MLEEYWFVFDSENYNLLAVAGSSEEASEFCYNSDKPTFIKPIKRGMNYLQIMLDLQGMFQERLGSTYTTQDIMNNVLYAEAELHELLRELNGFKSWKTYDWTQKEQYEHLRNAREEYIDALHFMWNIAIALDLDADHIMSIYAKKNAENHSRQDNGY